MTFFLSFQSSTRFSEFSLIFRIFTLLNVVHHPFLKRKTPFFTLFIFSRTSDNTTSQNIGGTNAWAVPPPQTLGGPSPSPLKFPPLFILQTHFKTMDNNLTRPIFADSIS